jgi:quercetin 2,3-dioxygenase
MSSITTTPSAVVQRGITRIRTTPTPTQGFIGPGHLAAEVISPNEFALNDPFIVLMDDRLDLPSGAPAGGAHPHAGFETVTFMVEGSLHDRDEGVLAAGDVQWMTAGRGIIHGESSVPQGKTRLLQLWLTLPKSERWVTPRFENIHLDSIPVRREPGAELRLYSGTSGWHRSATHNHVPVTLAEIRLDAGVTIDQELPSSYNGFLYVLEGSVLVGPEHTTLYVEQSAWLDRTDGDGISNVRITAGESGARVVLYAGQPQGAPIVMHGPFVADTRTDIVRLFKEFQAGSFERLSELTRAAKSGASADR